MKSSPGQQPKLFPLGIEFLHAPKVGGHQVNGSIEDAVIEGAEVALLNEQGADFLQSQGVVRSCVNCYASVVTFDELIALGECQPALFDVEEIRSRHPVSSSFRFVSGVSGTLETRADLLT